MCTDTWWLILTIAGLYPAVLETLTQITQVCCQFVSKRICCDALCMIDMFSKYYDMTFLSYHTLL